MTCRPLIAVLLTMTMSGCAEHRTLRYLQHVPLHIAPSASRFIQPLGSEGTLALAALETLTQAHGLALVYQEGLIADQGYVGMSDGHTVILDAGLGPNGRLQTLAHELAHLRSPRELHLQANYAASEVFAEAVATLICQKAGVDVRLSSATYLADIRTGLYIIDLYRDEIRRVVKELTPKK